MKPIDLLTFESGTIRHFHAKRSRKTLRQYSQVLRELRGIGAQSTADFTEETIDNWLEAWPQRTPVTFRSHLRCLSSLCTRAKAKGLLDADPFDVCGPAGWMPRYSRPPAPRRRYAKPAPDVRRVLHLCSELADSGGWLECRDEALFWTLFVTGERIGELCRTRLEDFLPEKGLIRIVPHWITGKGGRRYWWNPKTDGSVGDVPIGPHTVGLLSRWAKKLRYNPRKKRLGVIGCEWLFPGEMMWGPWVSGGPGNSPLDRLKALGEAAGVPGLTCKAARKGLASYYEIGLTELGRRRLLRHADADVADEFYDEQLAEERRGDALRIERFFTGT